MNIVEILRLGGINIGWAGPFPDNVDDLTESYINESVDGLPRLRWADGQEPLTAEELRTVVNANIDAYNASITEQQSELDEDARKLTGVEFNGVMCSATSKDMWGLTSVEAWVASGNDVPFEFENGNVLLLTAANYSAFRAVWVPFRASFFPLPE